jgi:hypothetical protein
MCSISISRLSMRGIWIQASDLAIDEPAVSAN